MSLERQILFWAVAVAAIFYVVYLLGSTITPFAAGIVLGYLLDPIVLKLQSLGLNRLGATLLILIAFALGVVIVLILVAPILSNQFIAFSQRLPDYAVRLQALAVEEGNALIAKYGGGWLHALGLNQQLSSAQIQSSVSNFVAQGAQLGSQRPNVARLRRRRGIQFPVAPDHHACRRLLYSYRLAPHDL